MDQRLTIGELARQAGTTTKTIRYYEHIGLLLPSEHGDNRYRYYDEAQVLQLRFIRRAQGLGLTLAEIGQLMDLAREIRCNELRSALDELFARKIRDYEPKIATLKTLQRSLQPEEHACACQAFVPDCACLPAV
jgi:DNA-binding transcriptional MerR regulator